MRNVLLVLLACLLLNGCASSPKEFFKDVAGVSTNDIEDSRPKALSKIFDSGYDACYAKVEKSVKKMAYVSVYAQDRDMIAIFYVNPNTTPAGIFFTRVDDVRTKVEVASPSISARDWIAKNIFSETSAAS